MKPEEAIEILEEIKELDDTLYTYSDIYMKALETAITALKEIQQYREIGTVEECRDAMEKQKPKVPEFTHMLGEYTGKFKCPICEQSFSYDCTDAKVFFCKKCGQALQMESEDD